MGQDLIDGASGHDVAAEKDRDEPVADGIHANLPLAHQAPVPLWCILARPMWRDTGTAWLETAALTRHVIGGTAYSPHRPDPQCHVVLRAGSVEMSIIVVGGANTDYIARGPRLPAGDSVEGSEFVEASGGKGLNQAVATARAGAAVSFIGAVGADDFGVRLRSWLQGEGIDVSRLLITDDDTGIASPFTSA